MPMYTGAVAKLRMAQALLEFFRPCLLINCLYFHFEGFYSSTLTHHL